MAKANRKTIDTVLTLLGTALTIFMVVIGGLSFTAYRFATDTVHDQLASQKVFFPELGSPALTSLPAADKAAMETYAGQQLVNGAQAKVYADNFIAVHLNEVAGGQTYSQVSAAALANPTDPALKAKAQVLFQGQTLRGLLLGDGYAYWTIGRIAGAVSLVSFAGAAVMAVLTLAGAQRITRSR